MSPPVWQDGRMKSEYLANFGRDDHGVTGLQGSNEQTGNAAGATLSQLGLRLVNAGNGEIQLLEGLMRYTRSAKRSRVREVSLAAYKWESIFLFRINVAMQERERRKRGSGVRGQGAAVGRQVSGK